MRIVFAYYLSHEDDWLVSNFALFFALKIVPWYKDDGSWIIPCLLTKCWLYALFKVDRYEHSQNISNNSIISSENTFISH